MPDKKVQIDVTPAFIEHPSACCRIEPTTSDDVQYVSGGIITLPVRGGPYELNFHLKDGIAADLEFDEQRPWSCRPDQCPDIGDQDERQYPREGQRVEKHGTLLKVRSRPAGQNMRYYSLNFTGGVRCDPVIIHD